MERRTEPGWKRWLSWIACLVVLGILLNALRRIDLSHAVALIARTGPWLALVAAPYLAAASCDALGSRRVLDALGRRVPWLALLRVRIACDALAASLPGGVALAETVNPLLLLRHGGVPVETAVPAMAARRWLVMRAHAIYIAAGALLGWRILSAASGPWVGGDWLPAAVLASAAVPFGLSVTLATTLARGSFAGRARRLLRRVPIAKWQHWLDASRSTFAAADSGFTRVADDRRGRTPQATALFLAGWLVESLESLLILRLLGAQLGYVEVMSFEAALSLVRCLAFFSPGGLGVQDLGYLSILSALHLPDATALGAAFVLVKRAKELFWVGIGYALAFRGERITAQSSPLRHGRPTMPGR